MTRDEIAAGLDLLVAQLAADVDRDVPPGWDPPLWAYVRGIASAELIRLRDRLVGEALVHDTDPRR